MNFTFVIVGSVVAALITHLVAAMLYMNPFVTKIYKKHKKHPAINNHSTDKKFMIDMFLKKLFFFLYVKFKWLKILKVFKIHNFQSYRLFFHCYLLLLTYILIMIVHQT